MHRRHVLVPEDPVTRVLDRLNAGERGAWCELLGLVDGTLRAMASRQMRGERAEHTLQPTALVHEAYLRMHGAAGPRFQDRRHFFGITARAMRQILVERYRMRVAVRRGGGRGRVPLDEAQDDLALRPHAPEVVDGPLEALRAAIEEMEARADLRRAARVVRSLFVEERTIPETASALGISEATVSRDWRFARAWLLARLAGDEARG